MFHCRVSGVLVLLGCLAGSPVVAQTPSDLVVLRVSHATRADRLANLAASRDSAALRLVAVAEEIRVLPDGAGRHRRGLLVEAQELAEGIVSLDEDMAVALPAVRESRDRLARALEAGIGAHRDAARAADPGERPGLEARGRELEAELAELRAPEAEVVSLRPPHATGEAPDPLASAVPALWALARVVAEEHARLLDRHRLQDELRLFLGRLQLFDETGMPPSVGADGGDPDAGCPITACPITGISPTDVAMAHFRPGDDRDGAGAGASDLTLASLATLQDRLAARADLPGVAAEEFLPEDVPSEDRPFRADGFEGLAREARTVVREVGVGAGGMGFRGDGDGLWGVGPGIGASFLLSRPLGTGLQLTVEPTAGVRSVRAGAGTAAEVAGEVRETVTGAWRDGRLRWLAVAWQKGRYLSDPLPLPGYLEPGRLEAGLAARLAYPLRDRWDLVLGAGGDGVRYAAQEWEMLDRQGLNASAGLAWHGESASGRVGLLASRHEFPRRLLLWERRADTRVGAEAETGLEGRVVTRVSAGLAWSDSRLPAYDFRAARAAIAVSAPWRSGSVQAYGALTHLAYRNPGPEDAGVALSDRDAGSILAVQLTRPLSATRALVFRADWSRSETGFRSDFYHRFGTSVQMTFRGLAGG
jgi:hypothetical protein